MGKEWLCFFDDTAAYGFLSLVSVPDNILKELTKLDTV